MIQHRSQTNSPIWQVVYIPLKLGFRRNSVGNSWQLALLLLLDLWGSICQLHPQTMLGGALFQWGSLGKNYRKNWVKLGNKKIHPSLLRPHQECLPLNTSARKATSHHPKEVRPASSILPSFLQEKGQAVRVCERFGMLRSQFSLSTCQGPAELLFGLAAWEWSPKVSKHVGPQVWWLA